MAISFVAGSRGPTSFPGSSNNTSSVACAKPTGVANGDVMLAFCQSGGAANHSAPAGWTLLSEVANDPQNLTSTIFYKVASSEGSSYTFTDDEGGTTPMCVQIVAYRGCDTTSSPIDVETFAGTAGTTTRACPDATSTAVGWFVWFRVGKTSTVNTEGDFSITSGTSRQLTSNRGGSTQYFVESADSNGELSVGLHSGASFTSNLTMTGSIERTVVLKTLADPASGGITATLPSVSSSFAGSRVMPDGPIDSTLPKVSAAFDGIATPPSGGITATLPGVSSAADGITDGAGGFTATLGSVTSQFTGEIIFGSFSGTLPSVTSTWSGGVEPIGGFTATLPFLTDVAFVGETQPFGEQVIHVEHESRAFHVIDDDPGLIYLRTRDEVNTA
jgi:hypothetical protein